jgi:hypothetical protein
MLRLNSNQAVSRYRRENLLTSLDGGNIVTPVIARFLLAETPTPMVSHSDVIKPGA